MGVDGYPRFQTAIVLWARILAVGADSNPRFLVSSALWVWIPAVGADTHPGADIHPRFQNFTSTPKLGMMVSPSVSTIFGLLAL